MISGMGDTIGLKGGRLADVAPTILALMALEAPPEMTGTSLIGFDIDDTDEVYLLSLSAVYRF